MHDFIEREKKKIDDQLSLLHKQWVNYKENFRKESIGQGLSKKQIEEEIEKIRRGLIENKVTNDPDMLDLDYYYMNVVFD